MDRILPIGLHQQPLFFLVRDFSSWGSIVEPLIVWLMEPRLRGPKCARKVSRLLGGTEIARFCKQGGH